jgi:hypothetical protein
MKYIIFLLIISQVDTAVPTVTTRSIDALTDDQACKILGDMATKMQPELPKTIDPVTRLDGVVVLCSLKTFANNKTILVKLSDFREGWQERKQQQWNKMNCENEAFKPLIDRGWRFTQNMTFVSGERINIDAKCNK